MKRFFVKIGRFFWSWGFLKFVLGCIAFVVLVYVEEDWRGAHEWAATKAKWEAKGETFDYSKFIPPPVPDEQNLAAIPLFKLELVKDSEGDTYPEPVPLKRAMGGDYPHLDLPPTVNWPKGEQADMAKIKQVIASNYAIVFKNAKPPDSTLAQFNAIYPFLTDFLAAAATRPVFRFNSDYTILPQAARPLGQVVALINLSRLLTLQAILAIDQHQEGLALEDIRVNCMLANGAKRDPSLVGGLVAMGIMAINHGAVREGLAQHSWTDAQAAELEQTLGQIDFLAGFQFAMRSEVAISTNDIDFFHRISRPELNKLFEASPLGAPPLAKLFLVPLPSGWWDNNEKEMATFLFHQLATVDLHARLVYANLSHDLKKEAASESNSMTAYAPWNIWFTISVAPLADETKLFARAQVWIDEARIACALERYRLAKGVYPGSFDVLAPMYIDEVPHDIMNGEAYHYRLNPDGTFLLYSVGWNQKDDGGKVAYKTGYDQSLKQIDYEKGDWVWPPPQVKK